MSDNKIFTMNLTIDDFMLRAVAESSVQRADPKFREIFSRMLRKLFSEIGGVIISMSVDKNEVQITWEPGQTGINATTGIIKMLEKGRQLDAILLLELFKSREPNNPDLLYNLGMAYSDINELERALTSLRKLLDMVPDHVNGRVALGVALIRQGNENAAIVELRKAVQLDPKNPWAQRNLGGCLLKHGSAKEAVLCLKRATELNPTDVSAWYGLGQAYEATGNVEEADIAYKQVVQIDEYCDVADLARQARSKIAEKTFRSIIPPMERMDAIMYCLGALEKYENMTPSDVRDVGFEVATLGMNGIDVNDPTAKYHLHSLPGQFSGLHLLCLEYVAFKQFAPEMDIGFDLSKEYLSAQSLFPKKYSKE